jgi:hypothetical protein
MGSADISIGQGPYIDPNGNPTQASTVGSGISGYANYIGTAPQEMALAQTRNPDGSIASTPGTTQPSAAEIQAQKDEAEKTGIRGHITNLVGSLDGIYKSIYGGIDKGGTEAATRLQDRYAKETGALTDTFNQELPKIGNSYAARGLYDSSYRMNGEEAAASGFNKQVGDLGDQLKLDQQTIGNQTAQNKAKYTADQEGYQALLTRLATVTDLTELRSLQNEIEAAQRTLTADNVKFQDAEQNKASYEKIAPTGDRSGTLTTTLSNVINSNAPRQLKIKTAETIIGSSGLSDKDKNTLLTQVTAQV